VLLSLDESEGRYSDSAQQRPRPHIRAIRRLVSLIKEILALLYVR